MDTADRFWSKVNKDGPVPDHRAELGSCWIWTACVVRRYGQFGVAHGQRVAAHRFAWESVNGPIPDGLWALHHCDRPLCVRPTHLFLGTVGDNTRDAAAKGRMTRGEAYWSAKLNEVAVREIRRLADTASRADLARRFKVSRRQVLTIINRQSWKWVT